MRGLRTKLHDLRCNFPILGTYDIIVLSETWLFPEIRDSELGLTGFQIFRLDRNSSTNAGSRGGGVLVAIRSNLKASLITTDINCIEQLFIILSYNSMRFLIGAVYLPPLSLANDFELHASCVEKLVDVYTPDNVLLCGDYNIPDVTWSFDDLGLITSNSTSTSAAIIADSFSF